MSLYFIVNNVHFALELMGAVVFLMAAWFTFDTYSLRKNASLLAQGIGLSLLSIFQVISGLNGGNDLLSYLGFALLGIGSLCLIGSFLKQQQLQVQAVVVIPAFSAWSAYLDVIAAALLWAVAVFSYRRAKSEFNRTWYPFSTAFALLALSWLCVLAAKGSQASPATLLGYALEFAAFVFLARWVWQFLQLRVRESMILIFLSVALFLSTIVTLAFSTILIGQIASQTRTNLITDARVLSLDIEGLKEQSLVKAQRIALEESLREAIEAEDLASIERIAEELMVNYKLGFLTITDPQGNVLVRAHTLSRRGDSLLGERAVEEALAGESFVTVESSPVERLSIRAASPIVSEEETVGIVIAGYPLDNALVDNLKRITGLEMFIYEGSTAVAASALATDGRTRATGVQMRDSAVRAAVLDNRSFATAQENLYGRPFMMGYVPLINGDDKVVGMIAAGKSQQDILDIANSTNRLTLMTVILIMLVLAYPMYTFTKRLSDNL